MRSAALQHMSPGAILTARQRVADRLLVAGFDDDLRFGLVRNYDHRRGFEPLT